MNILQQYTLDFVKRNRRSSIAIMVALLLTVTMLSGLAGFFWTMYTDNIRLELKENGNWHGELFDETYGRDLEQIENYASVEAVMVKGPWQVARLESENPRRQYLILRGANREYWESMPERNLIIEGRVPAAEGEIALSKQYFDAYPETKLGDVLTFPIGERLLDGEVRDPSGAFSENETFRQTGTVSYTVVGKWDVTTSSMPIPPWGIWKIPPSSRMRWSRYTFASAICGTPIKSFPPWRSPWAGKPTNTETIP